MPDPIRSIRRSPDVNHCWIGAGTTSQGAVGLTTHDLVVDGTYEADVILCERLDIGPGGKLTCKALIARESCYIAGSLVAEALTTVRPTIAATAVISHPDGGDVQCLITTPTTPRIASGAVIQASFRVPQPVEATEPKGGTLVRFGRNPRVAHVSLAQR